MAPVKLTDKDIDYLIRLVATEAEHKLVWSHPEEYSAQVRGIVDTVLNRVASGQWGSTVESVANAKRQFSKITGPKSEQPFGSIDKVPDRLIPAFLPNIVTSWVTARSNGTPSSIGGNLHYANPKFSDPSNMGWINALDGPKLGYGDSTHWHGTTAGFSPVEAVVEYGKRTGTAALQGIHDQQAEAQGYGAIPPAPLARPAYFNETGAPPVPATRPPPPPSLAATTGVKPLDTNASPALVAARARLQAARDARMGAPEAAAVTPALKGVRGKTTGITDPRPQLDWGQFRPSVDAGGKGSLLTGDINPSAPNPTKPPVAGLRLPTVPAAPASTTRPSAPVSPLPAAKPAASIIRTGQGLAGTVQMPAGARPSIVPPPPGNTLLTQKPAAAPVYNSNAATLNAARSEQAIQRGNTLKPPVAPVGPALTPPVPVARPITVAKPAYVPPVPVPVPKPPTFAGSATGNQYTAGQIYQSGGYLQRANADGTFTKLGKVGSSSSGNTLTVAQKPSTKTTSTSSSSSSSPYTGGSRESSRAFLAAQYGFD